MQADKSAIILEAQWMEKEIPRIEAELEALGKQEQELLTTPLDAVNRAYTETYRAERRRAHRFYHRRRSVTPTRYGYKERMLDVGLFSALTRVLIAAAIVLAVYIAYHNHQLEQTQKGVVWASVVLVLAIGLAFVPAFGDQIWERHARNRAQLAAQDARESEAFAREREERQTSLIKCRTRIAEDERQLKFARIRLNELRRELTSTDHGEPNV